MLRILGVILFASWISYPVLVLAGASHRTTFAAMGFLYIGIGALFLGGLLPLVRHFLFFQERSLNEFPPGIARTCAQILLGQVGMHRSKLEWIIITVFAGICFLVLGTALLCLAFDQMHSNRYLIDFFR